MAKRKIGKKSKKTAKKGLTKKKAPKKARKKAVIEEFKEEIVAKEQEAPVSEDEDTEKELNGGDYAEEEYNEFYPDEFAEEE